jgi:hypothetical protein
MADFGDDATFEAIELLFKKFTMLHVSCRGAGFSATLHLPAGTIRVDAPTFRGLLEEIDAYSASKEEQIFEVQVEEGGAWVDCEWVYGPTRHRDVTVPHDVCYARVPGMDHDIIVPSNRVRQKEKL